MMKKTLAILTALILVFAFSCKDDDPIIETPTQTSFDIGNVHYVADNTTSYQTDFGRILKVDGVNFELDIIFSDKENTIYNITDTLTGTDAAKAKCILKMENAFQFSTSGTIEYDDVKKTGTFTVNFESLNLSNGEIIVDTTISHSIIDFTDLTERDYNGAIMSEGELNDWKIRTNWELAECSIFNLKTATTLPGSIELMQYPNPFVSQFNMSLNIPVDSKIDLYFVNTNFEIEQKFNGIQQGNIALLLDNAGYKGNYYRLYYKIYSDSEQWYGTGNLKVQD